MNGLQNDLREKILVGSPRHPRADLRRRTCGWTTGSSVLDEVRAAARAWWPPRRSCITQARRSAPGTDYGRASTSWASSRHGHGGVTDAAPTIRATATSATSASAAPTVGRAASCSGERLADRLASFPGDIDHPGRVARAQDEPGARRASSRAFWQFEVTGHLRHRDVRVRQQLRRTSRCERRSSSPGSATR